MAPTDDFTSACKEAARNMRRLPRELRRELGNEVQSSVAEPLAQQIRRAYTGPWATVLATATKARVQTDPQVVVGGSRKVVSGGASARQLVYGNEWGGGKRVRALASNGRRRGHRRATTRQFAGPGRHTIFGTVEANLDRSLERFSEAVDNVIGKVLDRG